MTAPIAELDVPEERMDAKQVVSSTYIPVGNHMSGSFDGVTPITFTSPEDAQFLKLQALTANLRYRIDGVTPITLSVLTGFQLAAGSDVLIPCAVDQIIIVGEGSGTYEAQWVR